MWGSPLAIKWGAAPKAVVLNDGKGQGNNIAVFPTYVQGICAQLDLWRTSKNYANKRFADAIAIWSGHNEVESYIAFVLKRAPGMTRGTVMDDAFWRGPLAIPFLKAQAWHEAGKQYPAPDADWIEAQQTVMGGAAPPAKPELTTEWLQTSLNKLGAKPQLDVDGNPGPSTRAAISVFKASHGLPATTIVDQATIDALDSALAAVTPLIPEPPPIVLPAPGTNPPPNLAPTFWQRFVAMFKPKGAA